MNCRLCNSKELYKFLDLGYTPLADQFRRKEQLREPLVYYPLEVFLCEHCGFVQLGHVVSPEVMYKYDYPYESSTTHTGVSHYRQFANSTIGKYGLDKNALVIDIGSNVGVLLESFKEKGIRVLGIDPASNIVHIANKRGIETMDAFFSTDIAREIVKTRGKASVITATNVFAHIDDLEHFVKAVKLLLKEKGALIIELPYFLHLVKNLEYDTIYHEHLSYITLEPLIPFFRKSGMEIIDVEQKDIHGGSIRITVSRKNAYQINDRVRKTLALEKKHQLRDKKVLDRFAKRVEQNRQELLGLLRKLKNQHKKIVAVSAPAKGMTLLNYCKIGRETLDYVTEKASLKIGRYIPGDPIPVFADKKLLEDKPDYALLLAWNFADEIISNLEAYRKKGGKFIIPIPKPRIV